MRLAGGGVVVALIGGDGSGKSTCARELAAWLGPAFPAMQAHLGNPPRSLLTLVAGGALKVQHRLERLRQRAPKTGSFLELFRHLCTARDRFRLYEKVRRFAVSGGIAVCERYPVLQNRKLVGPCIPELLPPEPGALANLLQAAEASYYTRMLSPDVLCVLRLDPELAVIRKPEEPADYVRTRGRIIWETDWSSTQARVLDASQPLPEVLRRLKAIVWSTL
jgi:thymidylate kinase